MRRLISQYWSPCFMCSGVACWIMSYLGGGGEAEWGGEGRKRWERTRERKTQPDDHRVECTREVRERAKRVSERVWDTAQHFSARVGQGIECCIERSCSAVGPKKQNLSLWGTKAIYEDVLKTTFTHL